LYLSTRVVRVTVMCKYARIKLYDFTVMESEENREPLNERMMLHIKDITYQRYYISKCRSNNHVF